MKATERTTACAEPSKTLLYATDLPMVASTWAYVQRLAADLCAQVEVLHVLEPSWEEGVVASLAPRHRSQLHDDAARRIRADINRDGEARRTSGVTVVSGDAIASILAAADAVGADMIIVGMPTGTTIGRLLRGSLTPGLLRHARLPVLVVPR